MEKKPTEKVVVITNAIGERRLGFNRRIFSYDFYIPEKRNKHAGRRKDDRINHLKTA